ncbi:hypothetical protein P3L10_006183 [Capsicum annuum]|uniref:uncharacterized protein LOC124896289 n=1 Tax=Capsicum annuum TaxID=4072 RepID=UPI001FB17564|nr:uncharacterized protein LOC124896289 [Capsicum annuum]
MNGQPDGQSTNLDRTVSEINNTDNNSARSDEDDSIAHFQDAQDPYEDDDSGMTPHSHPRPFPRCLYFHHRRTNQVDLQVAPPQQRVNQHQQAQLTGRTNQPVLVPGAAANPNAAGNSRSSQSQLPWRRMSRSDYQKYSKVFMAVDTDRDGKITGQEARNLFLSWKLPRVRSLQF